MRRLVCRPGLALVAALLSVALSPHDAGANSCSIECTYGSKCKITCDSDAQYVIFGQMQYDGNDAGYGVCYFDIDDHVKGSFVGYAASATFAPEYNVSLGSGNDLARLGDTGDFEDCGYYDGKLVEVKGYLPTQNYSYTFNGQAGDDWLFLRWLIDIISPTYAV